MTNTTKIKHRQLDKKRHGHHKKHSHSFRKVYWPYLPMLGILLFVLVVGSLQPRQVGSVLGLATDIDAYSLLSSTNEQRAYSNSKPLSYNETLARAAQQKAEDMRDRDYWSHETPDGQQPWIFLENVDYTYQTAGENLAYGFLSSEATIDGWMNSTSHRENLLNNSYQEVGFGIVDAPNYLSRAPQTIVVAFYARPSELAANNASAEQNFVAPALSADRARVTFAQSLTSWSSPFINFALGAISGAAAIFLLARHGLRLKRLMRSGEAFVMHHPVLDLTVTALLAVAVLLSQTAGFIL